MSTENPRDDFSGDCGRFVGKGSLSFPCRLPKGHPKDEPCMAPESLSSVVLHRRWEESQSDPSTPAPEQGADSPEPQPSIEPVLDPEPVRVPFGGHGDALLDLAALSIENSLRLSRPDVSHSDVRRVVQNAHSMTVTDNNQVSWWLNQATTIMDMMYPEGTGG